MRISDGSSDVCSSDLLAAARVPAAPVLRPGEALAQPQVAAMGLVEPVDYPGANGALPVIRAPIRLSGSDKAAARRAPLVGEPSDAILAEIGYDPATISALRAAQILLEERETGRAACVGRGG